MQVQEIANEYSRNGFSIANDIYSLAEISELINALEAKSVFDYAFEDNDSHNLFKSIDAVRELAVSDRLLSIAKAVIGENAIPFNAIVLDKTKTNNWGLDWHQDLRIAVKNKQETEGYINWSVESGIPHVVPPLAVLSKLLQLRVHLDDCDSTNGAIWVLPGTHLLGIIEKEHIQETVSKHKIVDCHVKMGGIMLMSPLLLHKSPYSLTDKSRRILQIEYRATELGGGLSWYD